jgi:hypothetical protein
MADKKISALTGASTPLAGTEVLPIVQSGATVKVAVSDLTAGRAMAASSLTTATVQASNSGGLALKNSGGTTQMLLGGGGGDNITLSVATNITPANAAVAISPTGTGTLTLNPATASTINNMSIGATTALAGRFTDVTLTTGNLVVASGQGVDFSATSGTGTSELLADYEEGTWTPAPFFSTSNTYTAGSVYGSYTKVGRLVSVTFLLSFEKNTATGNFTITGLPFTSLNSAGNRGALAVSYLQRIGQADKIVTGFVAENTTTIQLYFTGQTSASTIVNITDSDIDSNTASVVGTVTYQV